MFSFLKKYALSLLVTIVITYLSLFRPPKPPQEFDIPNLDKLVHVCMYYGMAGMIWLDRQRGHWQQPLKSSFVAAILLPLAYGGLTEVLQETLTIHRSGSWADFLADFIGILLAWLTAYFIRKRVG